MLPEWGTPDPTSTQRRSLRVVSLFSGIGGLDLGFEQAGHRVVSLCEYWPPAQRVLAERFPGVPLSEDVRGFHPDVPYDILTAGFPCVDLSNAGEQRGIFGPQSGLVSEVFRIAAETKPAWIVIENVVNLLRLGRGAGIAHVVDSLELLGYRWAYRVLDSRFSGVPQRRRRVILIASLVDDPERRLLADDAEFAEPGPDEQTASGFYWTEGRRGVGLVRNAIPTLKGGSTLGLPSAPAIWVPSADIGRRIVVPTTEHGERLQGFPVGWTAPAVVDGEPNHRWKLVGNAVTVGVARWIGEVLARPAILGPMQSTGPLDRSRPWPDAAFGGNGSAWRSGASQWPEIQALTPLAEVIADGATHPLSRRATAGFLSRVENSGIKLDPAFLCDLSEHMHAMDVDTTRSWASSPTVRTRMQRVRPRDSAAEMKLRRALTALGARYRLQVRVLPTARWRSDIVFGRARVVVDVRGCYWHACPIHHTKPKANAERWAQKFEDNRARDARMIDELTLHGWHVEVVWEHEDASAAAQRVMETVRDRTTDRQRNRGAASA